MRNLLRRIQKLESRLTGTTGLAPYSEPWYAYWENILECWMAGENPVYAGTLPLAVVDRMIERADSADGLTR